jgi:hypothetical protein
MVADHQSSRDKGGIIERDWKLIRGCYVIEVDIADEADDRTASKQKRPRNLARPLHSLLATIESSQITAATRNCTKRGCNIST